MNDQRPPEEIQGLDPAELTGQGMKTPSGSAGVRTWIPPTVERLGELLPPYRIECLLARGGMGAVYRGVHVKLDRTVAIKVLPAELAADELFVARFEREARTLAKLHHQRIVAIYDFGRTQEGHLYFVMEFVDGTDLAQIIRTLRLTPAQALDLTVQVCEALHYAHRQGVVHRDIKPGNILITRDGQTKLADFGLARPQRQEQSALTRSDIVIGTPVYMAPEQCEGQADHRADIYALGVVLYEMLTGVRPEGVFDPPSVKAGVDERLDQVVFRAMQEEPERRYQDISELHTDVERIRSTPPPIARKSRANLVIQSILRLAPRSHHPGPGTQDASQGGIKQGIAIALLLLLSMACDFVWTCAHQGRHARHQEPSATGASLPTGPLADVVATKAGRQLHVVDGAGKPLPASSIPAGLRKQLEALDHGWEGSGLLLADARFPSGELDHSYGAGLLGKGFSVAAHQPFLWSSTMNLVISCPLSKQSYPCQLEVAKLGYKVLQIPLLEMDPTAKIIWLGDLALEPYSRTAPVWYRVKGAVVTEDGKPVNAGEATLRVNGTSAGVKSRIASGQYEFKDITPGKYLIEFQMENFSASMGAISVQDAGVTRNATAYPLQRYLVRVHDPGDARQMVVTAGTPDRKGNIAFKDRSTIDFVQNGKVTHLDCSQSVRMRIRDKIYASGSYRWTGNLQKGDTVELLAHSSDTVLHKIECMSVGEEVAHIPDQSSAPGEGPGPSTDLSQAPALAGVPAQTPASGAARRITTVVIDAGHGGEDPGAVYGKVYEKHLNLDVAKRLQILLRRTGYKTLMTRERDTSLPSAARAGIANRDPDGVFVSIHCSSSSQSSDYGIESFYHTESSYELGSRIHASISRKLHPEDRGLKPASRPELCDPMVPAVVVHGGFLSHAGERHRLLQAWYRQAIAEGICAGITMYDSALRRGEVTRSPPKAATQDLATAAKPASLPPSQPVPN